MGQPAKADQTVVLLWPRCSQRVAMIDLGLVEWLIQRLSADANSMKAYTLEYSTALLMNLCLHQRAKERCVPLAKTLLQLLMMLLGTSVTQVSPSPPPHICTHTHTHTHVCFQAKLLNLSPCPPSTQIERGTKEVQFHTFLTLHLDGSDCSALHLSHFIRGERTGRLPELPSWSGRLEKRKTVHSLISKFTELFQFHFCESWCMCVCMYVCMCVSQVITRSSFKMHWSPCLSVIHITGIVEDIVCIFSPTFALWHHVISRR